MAAVVAVAVAVEAELSSAILTAELAAELVLVVVLVQAARGARVAAPVLHCASSMPISASLIPCCEPTRPVMVDQVVFVAWEAMVDLAVLGGMEKMTQVLVVMVEMEVMVAMVVRAGVVLAVLSLGLPVWEIQP